jgi:hypothetical protein
MELTGGDLQRAREIIKEEHYLHAYPRGRQRWFEYDGVILAFTWPRQDAMSLCFFGQRGLVTWELARLWAPDDHGRNALTHAIACGCKEIRRSGRVDAFFTYADPSRGYGGGVYRAASWLYDGEAGNKWGYVNRFGWYGDMDEVISMKHFGGMDQLSIWKLGFNRIRLPRKMRFVRLVSLRGKLLYRRKGG